MSDDSLPDWVEWLIAAALEYHAKVIFVPNEGGAQAYLFPLKLAEH